jgi:hypothetical protein
VVSARRRRPASPENLSPIPQVVRDLAQPQRHLVVPRTRRLLLPRRGPVPERRRGGKRQHGGERDRPALPDDGPQGGRHDTTGGGEEQCASSPNTDRDASSCTRAREG